MAIPQPSVVITGLGAAYVTAPGTRPGESLAAATQPAFLNRQTLSASLGQRIEQALQIACRQALNYARLFPPSATTGFIVGSALASYAWVQEALVTLSVKGRPTLSQSLYYEANTPTSLATTALGLQGTNLTFTTGKVAGLQALLCALHMVRLGQEGQLLVASYDAPARDTDESLAWSVALVIESTEQATARNASTLAGLLGGALLAADAETVQAAAYADAGVPDGTAIWCDSGPVDCGAVSPLLGMCALTQQPASMPDLFGVRAQDGSLQACVIGTLRMT